MNYHFYSILPKKENWAVNSLPTIDHPIDLPTFMSLTPVTVQLALPSLEDDKEALKSATVYILAEI